MDCAFSINIQVGNCEQPDRFEEFEIEVSTERLFSRVSRVRLQRLGIGANGKSRIGMIEGQAVEREFASVQIAAEGRSAFENVVIAEQGEAETLGSHSLDAFGLAVDPIRKKLVPTIMLALAVH